jgi:hypothetical protein
MWSYPYIRDRDPPSTITRCDGSRQSTNLTAPAHIPGLRLHGLGFSPTKHSPNYQMHPHFPLRDLIDRSACRTLRTGRSRSRRSGEARRAPVLDCWAACCLAVRVRPAAAAPCAPPVFASAADVSRRRRELELGEVGASGARHCGVRAGAWSGCGRVPTLRRVALRRALPPPGPAHR